MKSSSSHWNKIPKELKRNLCGKKMEVFLKWFSNFFVVERIRLFKTLRLSKKKQNTSFKISREMSWNRSRFYFFSIIFKTFLRRQTSQKRLLMEGSFLRNHNEFQQQKILGEKNQTIFTLSFNTFSQHCIIEWRIVCFKKAKNYFIILSCHQSI